MSWAWRNPFHHTRSSVRRVRVECGYPWQKGQSTAEMVSDALELASDYRSFIEVDPAKRVTAANEQSGLQGAS